MNINRPLRIARPVLIAILLSNCNSMVYLESPNQNSRIDYIVIHGTSENFAESLRLLATRTANPVSAHYLIPRLEDPTYPHRSIRVYSLVEEDRRAWHAGISFWGGESGLNDRSIGIELVNEFECDVPDNPIEETVIDDIHCEFLPYPEEQIQSLVELLNGILGRFPSINPIDIVGHSDIAILRRSDPGPIFPWERLYQEGIGAWPDDLTTSNYREKFAEQIPSVESVQEALAALGYDIEVTGEFDPQTQFVLRAFQMHFRPTDYSGQIDSETVALLWSLVEKYRAGKLRELTI